MQLWPGALNDTHVDEIPGSDGPVETDRKFEGCATQVAVGEQRDAQTCTSCKDGFVFMMLNVTSRSGNCQEPKRMPVVKCAKLSGGLIRTTASENTLCTKVGLAQQKIHVSNLTADAREHFAAVEGKDGSAVALCLVRKEVIVPSSEMLAALAPVFTPLSSQTVCDENLMCDVHKTVTCEKVCKLVQLANKEFGAWQYDSCNETLCDGTHGATACSATAMMA